MEHATPWSETGTCVKYAQSTQDAIKMAGLDDPVGMTRTFVPTLDKVRFDIEDPSAVAEVISEEGPSIGGMQAIPDRFCTRNMKIGTPYDVVGGRYKIIQNEHAFEMFDSMLKDGRLRLDRAGKLSISGSRVWLLARVGDPVYLTSEDSLEQYMVLLNSHDGSIALRVINTPIRTSTGATAIATIDDAGVLNSMAIRHTENAKQRMALAEKIIASSLEYYSSFAEAAGRMVRKKMTAREIDHVLGKMFPCRMDGDKPVYSTRTQNQMDLIKQLFNDEPMGSVRGSAWSFYAAVAEFVDFHRSPTKTDVQKHKRLQSLVDGAGAKLKTQAFREVLSL